MLLVLAATVWVLPRIALACGGFFCSNTPVDQNAERVLFEVHGDGTITAFVEISYTGEPGDFSWVVPVPDTPELGTVSQSTLRFIDAATAPRIRPPRIEWDYSKCGYRGLGATAETTSMSASGGGAAAPEAPKVTVIDLPQVGAFDPEVISSDDAALLIAWLGDNGYLITPEMEPFIAGYVEAGMKFLGMKLAPDAGVAEISPIKMTYPSMQPMVPLVLTAVATEPELSVVVMIAASERYRSANWANLEISPDQIYFDPKRYSHNYYSLVSALMDANGGQALITELAQPTSAIDLEGTNVFVQDRDQALSEAKDLLGRHNYLTRLYGRISAWEINKDPGFEPSYGGDVSNILDLSNRAPVVIDVCGDSEPQRREPCGGLYCGVDSSCAVVGVGSSEAVGCRCADGSVARVITDPSPAGSRTVMCQPESFDLLASVSGGMNPCVGYDCGVGVCVVVGGFATCRCDAGYAAVGMGLNLECREIILTYAPDHILTLGASGCGCNSGAGRSWVVLVLVLLYWRRARNRC